MAPDTQGAVVTEAFPQVSTVEAEGREFEPVESLIEIGNFVLHRGPLADLERFNDLIIEGRIETFALFVYFNPDNYQLFDGPSQYPDIYNHTQRGAGEFMRDRYILICSSLPVDPEELLLLFGGFLAKEGQISTCFNNWKKANSSHRGGNQKLTDWLMDVSEEIGNPIIDYSNTIEAILNQIEGYFDPNELIAHAQAQRALVEERLMQMNGDLTAEQLETIFAHFDAKLEEDEDYTPYVERYSLVLLDQIAGYDKAIARAEARGGLVLEPHQY